MEQTTPRNGRNMKLIGANASPYVRKVRIVMAEKKLDYQFVQENVWADDTAIAKSNPLGKVPCLVMEDGSTLIDSKVIVEYLDTLTPVCKLLPAGGNGRERAGGVRHHESPDIVLIFLYGLHVERMLGVYLRGWTIISPINFSTVLISISISAAGALGGL